MFDTFISSHPWQVFPIKFCLLNYNLKHIIFFLCVEVGTNKNPIWYLFFKNKLTWNCFFSPRLYLNPTIVSEKIKLYLDNRICIRNNILSWII